VGGGRVDRRQDWRDAADAAELGAPARARQRLREEPTIAEAQRVKDLEREVRELRKTNAILKLASAYFAPAELNRRFKP
jgi:transposase-like protein